MNKDIKKTAAFLVALLILVLTISSCHRGYGCPYDFSIENGLEKVVNTIK